MSKSDPNSAIFMEDAREEVERKIKKAFCPPQVASLTLHDCVSDVYRHWAVPPASQPACMRASHATGFAPQPGGAPHAWGAMRCAPGGSHQPTERINPQRADVRMCAWHGIRWWRPTRA